MTVTDRNTAEHYLWQGDCNGWRLLDTPGLAVTEERMPPARAEVPHRHVKAQQLFYVLRGRLEITLDGAPHQLAQGQALHVPAGAAHQVRSPGPEAAEFLVISAPSTRYDREPL